MQADKSLARARNTMDDWFENVLETVGFSGESAFDQPAIGMRTTPANITEKTDEYNITLEVPGVDRKDVHVDIRDGGLEIHAEVQREYKEENERMYRMERSNKDYYRYIRLPHAANLNKAQAKLKHGVLHIRVPKHEHEKKKQQIEVKD